METLIKFTYQMGTNYTIYIPLVAKVLQKNKLQLPQISTYEQLVKNIKDGLDINELDVENLLPNAAKRKDKRSRENHEQQSPTSDSKRANLTLDEIRRTWLQGSRRISKEDWLEWLRKFNIELIKESPSLSLRSCYPIALMSNSVARDLFNPAFLTCWTELNIDQQKVSGFILLMTILIFMFCYIRNLWNVFNVY